GVDWWVDGRVGAASTFWRATADVLLWAVAGTLFGWSDTWQLVINTGTTIVTFLMVFVIQNTQSRDTQAMQLKLDELIRVNEKAGDWLRRRLDRHRLRHGLRVGAARVRTSRLHGGGPPQFQLPAQRTRHHGGRRLLA